MRFSAPFQPLPGVFALYGEQSGSEPYLTRAADLRRRMKRLLDPPESQSKRLNLRERVARIEYTITGSEFESTLTLYHATAAIFGYAEARRRLRLHTPTFLRFTDGERSFPASMRPTGCRSEAWRRCMGRSLRGLRRSDTATPCSTSSSCGAAMKTLRLIRSIRAASMAR